MKLRYYKQIMAFAKRYQKRRIYPATVICAWYGKYVNIDKSGKEPNLFAVNLENALKKIGKIGERINGNFLGNCSEVRSSNKILLWDSKLTPNKIKFSEAVRPRTLQIIPRCDNCKRTFR